MCPFTPTEVSLFEKGRPAPTLIKAGVEGAQAPSQGVWGMCPQNFRRRGELPTLAHPPRVGPKTLANPQPTGVGKRGGQGAQAPWQGVWGMCPQATKIGASCPLWKPRHEWGPKPWQTLSLRGWENGGARGAKPPRRVVVGGCPPTKP